MAGAPRLCISERLIIGKWRLRLFPNNEALSGQFHVMTTASGRPRVAGHSATRAARRATRAARLALAAAVFLAVIGWGGTLQG
jgi:hypothetical protein